MMNVPMHRPMNQRKIVPSKERSGKTALVIASKATEKRIQNPIVRKILLLSIAVTWSYEPVGDKERWHSIPSQYCPVCKMMLPD